METYIHFIKDHSIDPNVLFCLVNCNTLIEFTGRLHVLLREKNISCGHEIGDELYDFVNHIRSQVCLPKMLTVEEEHILMFKKLKEINTPLQDADPKSTT